MEANDAPIIENTVTYARIVDENTGFVVDLEHPIKIPIFTGMTYCTILLMGKLGFLPIQVMIRLYPIHTIRFMDDADDTLTPFSMKAI